MKSIKKTITAIMFAASLIGINVYSTSAVAQLGTDASYGRITAAIKHCLELLNTSKAAVDKGADKEMILKLMKAVRQESKEITGDNFGAELDFAQDDLKRAYRAVKKHESQTEMLESIDLAIKGFQTLKKLEK